MFCQHRRFLPLRNVRSGSVRVHGSGQRFVHGACQAVAHTRQDVRVGVEGYRYVGVPEHL